MFRTHTLAEQLTGLVAAVGALAAAAVAGAQPTIDLTGVVRDFRKNHADFNAPAAAAGHYAGNVGLALGVAGTPVYVGGGFRVDMQWRDSSNKNIAPHLFGNATGSCLGSPIGVMAFRQFYIRNQSKVYGYVYNTTPLGGVPVVIMSNALDTCEVMNSSDVFGYTLVRPGVVPSTVINVSPNSDIWGPPNPGWGNLPAMVGGCAMFTPTGLGPSTGALTFNSDAEIATNLHVDSLTITGAARVTTKPGTNLTILVENDCVIDANAAPTDGLFVGAGSILDLHVKGDMVVLSRAEAVDQDPSRLRCYMLGPQLKTLDVRGNVPGTLRAQVFAGSTSLELTQDALFFGTFWGTQFDMENNCKAYIDMALPTGDVDRPGTAGPAGGAITSAATFDEWFTDVPGVNLSKSHTITLIDNGIGIYEYLDDAFFPIDGDLFGNEMEGHNNNFTYSIDATFDYTGCGNQFVEFQGADDFWLFIDGALVMDLGGIQPMAVQYLQLNRLGLAVGQHDLKLVYAQRRPTMATFRLRTNLLLASTATAVSVSEPGD